ncbi:MAG: hypothetical protein LBR57_04570 [Alistipes sp.]|jgi:hypothetical protein|nr:hypothetical protein [Alistipes sp.]
MFVTTRRIFFSASIGKDLWSNFGAPRGIIQQSTFQGQESVFDDSANVAGIHDITGGMTEFLDRDPVSRKLGLVNDLDGGLSFWPRYYNESENELVDVWEAYEMKDLLTEEYFAAHPPKDPAAHGRLRTLLKNLKEDDNPVIVVAKLKQP